ncbi:MAG: HupE/UreJ family protein [Gemmatimonadota bacterium]|nr:HupE/UreJ family protein [Gemmatimonadota bacterium]
MSEFEIYLQLGFNHIADLNAYDHIVFIIALCAVYQPRQWRMILMLVTAFTIGHSITLALATLSVILVPMELIEFLIPVTIFATCIMNVVRPFDEHTKRKVWFNYPLALFFGLIHGMGFSYYLRALLGMEESIVMPLFSFNIGLELGQLMIVTLVLAGAALAVQVFKAPHKSWNLFISGVAAGVAIILMMETKFW